MGDLDTVCCLCGDIGFSDKLFRCNKCHNRFQHSYCSSFYRESAEPIEECDWCQSASSKQGQGSSKKPMASGLVITNRSGYSGDHKMKHQQHDESADHNNKGKSPTPSPRTATRRYKLLKDVMC